MQERDDVHEAHESRDSRVPCPECGARFSSRGLAGHRRLKHGVAGNPSMGEVRDTLDTIRNALGRLDERLRTLESRGDEGADEAAEKERLRKELDRVLAEIAGVQGEHDQVHGDDMEARGQRRDCHERLGRLRRHQVRLLYRLGPLAANADPEAPFEDWETY